MRRFTILGLMGLVLGLAVAITALRNADDYWAGGLMLAMPLLVGVATLDAAYHTDRRRAGRLGFAIFAGGYFALTFLGLSDQNLARLPTTRLLLYAHQRVAPPQTFTFTVTASPPATMLPGTILTSNVTAGPLAGTVTTTTTSALTPGQTVTTPLASARWRAMLPGAANLETFSIVGHCLFALLAGLVGGTIAVWFWRKRELADGVSPSVRPGESPASAGTNCQEESGR